MKQLLTNVFQLLFNISLPVSILLGMVIVVVQLVAVIISDGQLAIYIDTLLKVPTIRIIIITAFSGFFLGYLKPGKKSLE